MKISMINIHTYANKVIYILEYKFNDQCISFNLVPILLPYMYVEDKWR